MTLLACSSDTNTWLAGHTCVRVVALRDPVVEAVGFDARSGYVEAYWLCILGPTALFTLRRLSEGLIRQPEGFSVELSQLARELGLGDGTGRHAPVVKAVSRLVVFNLAAVEGDTLAVRRSVPPLARRHLARLPRDLAERHRAEMQAPSATCSAGPSRSDVDGSETWAEPVGNNHPAHRRAGAVGVGEARPPSQPVRPALLRFPLSPREETA